MELLGFNGLVADKFNLLTWTTAREERFSHYAVERSPEGVSGWDQLGAVAGAGNVEGEQAYRFTDNQPLPLAYYRLRSVDLDGSHSYSHVILLEQPEADLLQIYPNPSNGRFFIDLPLNEEQSATLRIFDAAGRLLVATSVSGQQYDNQEYFRPGVYLLVVETRSERWTRRVTILR